MSSYVQSTLIKDEKVIYEGRLSAWSLMPLIILGFLSLAMFGLGLVFWLVAYLKYQTTELAFTNKRVIAKFGILSRRTIELNLIKVESLQVDQSLIGRLLNYGTLIISGAGNPQAPIPGISSPMVFRRSFMEFQDRIREPQAA